MIRKYEIKMKDNSILVMTIYDPNTSVEQEINKWHATQKKEVSSWKDITD